MRQFEVYGLRIWGLGFRLQGSGLWDFWIGGSRSRLTYAELSPSIYSIFFVGLGQVATSYGLFVVGSGVDRV